jgi:DnaJ-class molecular chaperone
MNKDEALAILGISPDPIENIKKAYLRLSKENHPDKGGDPSFFVKIHEAYLTLTHVEQSQPNKIEDIELNIQISLEEAIFGVLLESHLRPQAISSTPLLNGERKSTLCVDILTIIEKIPPMILLNAPYIKKTYNEKIVGGVKRNIKMTYTVKEHPRYKPSKNKKIGLLTVQEKIPVTTALCGGNVEVETLFGIRKLYIKPGTDIGDVYEIKDHGPLGSLFVEITGFQMPKINDLNPSNEQEKEIQNEEQEMKNNKDLVDKLKAFL